MEESKNPDSDDSKDNKSKSKADDGQDFDPLKGHKYELKFEYNPASKRSRRILI